MDKSQASCFFSSVKNLILFGSLRLGVQEDLEELRREEEELKRKRQSKKMRTH